MLYHMSIKNISDFDNQETIAKLLWKIRMIRIKLGADCLIMGALKLVFVILFLWESCSTVGGCGVTYGACHRLYCYCSLFGVYSVRLLGC